MTILFDTQLLIWAAREPERLPVAVREIIEDWEQALFFSVITIWEVAIKTSLGKPEFSFDSGRFRKRLIDHGFRELPVAGEHAVAVQNLVQIHKDPFDRLMIAQASVERLILFTIDKTVARYPGAIRLV